MPKGPKGEKRPADANQLAKLVVEIATDQSSDTVPSESPMAKLGRAGGLKGGAARSASLTPKQRSDIAKKAAASRWRTKDISGEK